MRQVVACQVKARRMIQENSINIRDRYECRKACSFRKKYK